jgi:hypothetical protein
VKGIEELRALLARLQIPEPAFLTTVAAEHCLYCMRLQDLPPDVVDLWSSRLTIYLSRVALKEEGLPSFP